MPVLSVSQRKVLEAACLDGRRRSEQAVRAALISLAVTAERVPSHLGPGERRVRNGLRAKSRQLGDQGDNLDLLVAECAYEQWHRLLFARFLAENGLLIHPKYETRLTIDDCDELAESLGEPDGWSVAARFAAEILPGIFRLDDPCVQLRLAPEGRLALEEIVSGVPSDIFTADDALGWVYQFWQKDKKDEVNRSERKIGGADLGPVTQLFTENYMVRFLLENSLGAWWAARHPESPLLKDWEYLRCDDDGRPAAGSFDRWPDSVAEITVMDPCCGSGHFLVEAFGMLWQMRVEEEGLDPIAAQDAVLRENLFGLEIDPRCVQIAMFAVALEAWKAGGGWRELPVPNIACSGIPVRASIEEWEELGGDDPLITSALDRLHALFRDAEKLGSLIDPKHVIENTAVMQRSLYDVDWVEVAPILDSFVSEETLDPSLSVLGLGASALGHAAKYLTMEYTLVLTNVPWLKRAAQDPWLRGYCERFHNAGKSDLATSFAHRWLQSLCPGYVAALILPQNWLTLKAFERFRRQILNETDLRLIVRLGSGAFEGISGEVVNPVLLLLVRGLGSKPYKGLDLSDLKPIEAKVLGLRADELRECNQHWDLERADARITLLGEKAADVELLSEHADGVVGIQTSDDPRYKLWFWEVQNLGDAWEVMQDPPSESTRVSGCSAIVRWERGTGSLTRTSRARQGRSVWGRPGIIVARLGEFDVNLYYGQKFHQNAAVIAPRDSRLVMPIFAYCQSGSFEEEVRKLDQKMNVTNATLVKVPFDRHHWQQVADERYPTGLPEPWSDDPTQWLFEGRPEVGTEPLQVAVGRLLGYRWPEQAESDDLDVFAAEDGIVCIPSVRGERTAAQRLQELLARACGTTWSPSRSQELIGRAGSKKRDLDSWLRDDFFKAHCKVFKNRPFIWQIWDGRTDGFSALLNYHRLDRPALEKLTYSYLGAWIERQQAGARDDMAGAEDRLAAAQRLRHRLELILEGEPPYDIYVRWKTLAEQPIGWEPDLNDGVRINVRPFVKAEVLRAKFNVKWEKDRGKNPDGSERINDLNYTRAEKQAARQGAST